MGYDSVLGVQRKILKSSRTFPRGPRIIKASKMPKHDDEQGLVSLTKIPENKQN
jgi:hypothetical protein